MNQVSVWGKNISRARVVRAKTAARKTLEALKIKNTSLEVFFLPDADMKRLKRRFFPKKSGVANVLAFPDRGDFPHPERRKRGLGEIYINQSFFTEGFEEVVFLLIHGILHLLGYNHEEKGDIIKMERLEKMLVKRALPLQ